MLKNHNQKGKIVEEIQWALLIVIISSRKWIVVKNEEKKSID